MAVEARRTASRGEGHRGRALGEGEGDMACRKAPARFVAVVVAVVVAPAVITACGERSGRTAPVAQGSGARSPGAQGSGAQGSGAQGPGGSTVLVVATEMRFTLSARSGRPGLYTFVLSNAGHVRHALSIQGPGVATATSEPADGGGEAELTVSLRTGTYALWCPIGRHRRLGMHTGFTVR